MVSTLQRRLMMTQLKVKITSQHACRLCHGPLTSPSPDSPPVRASSPTGEPVDCHPHCIQFACGGCVDKDRANYGMMDLSNNYDAHCALCVEDEEDGAGWGGKVVLSTSP